MAHTDYIARNIQGSFCPVATVQEELAHASTTATLLGLSEPQPGSLRVAMAAMINQEIVGVSALAGNVATLIRGCCDTIPQVHAPGSRIYFFDDGVIADRVEYGGSETVSVKPLPRTATGGPLAKSKSPPRQVTFNFRFARPYPPGKALVNGNPWHSTYTLAAGAVESLELTWAHRDRISQQNVLVAHEADSIGPEPGVTYEALIYKGDNTLLRTVEGIEGESWAYRIFEMANDFEVTEGVHVGYIRFRAVRGEFASWQDYRVNFNFNAVGVEQPAGLGFRLGEFLGGVMP